MCTKLNEVNVSRRISNVAGPTQFSLVRLKSTWLVEDSVYIFKALAIKNAFQILLNLLRQYNVISASRKRVKGKICI